MDFCLANNLHLINLQLEISDLYLYCYNQTYSMPSVRDSHHIESLSIY